MPTIDDLTMPPGTDAERPLQRRDDFALSDVYTRTTGQVFMRGIQALVRLPMVQARNDRKAGLNTGGYISGYRGSPLSAYDYALADAKSHLDACDVLARPAVNEELAASAVWGTQQLHLSPGARKDGVFGIWYGKGPGVDRTGDVFKHGNLAGTSAHGGILCIAGDDHAAKSSPAPHQSDHAFISALMPVLYPSGPHEFVSMGLLGIAMSRYSGCWVGMKVISDTAESTTVVDLAEESRIFTPPADFTLPEGGLNLRWPDDRFSQDYRLQTYKPGAALAFGRANGVDRVTLDAGAARFGIVASGKAHEEVREALALLGLDHDAARRIGLRVLKIGMIWPLDPVIVRRFASGLEEVLVVEERREVIEDQIKQHLFNAVHRPRVVGKRDETDAPFLQAHHEFSVDMIAEKLAARLLRHDLPEDVRGLITTRAEALSRRRAAAAAYTAPVKRQPYFCAGCPHNASTKVPEGSRALAGIGCHFMAMWMDRSTETFTPMGCEGVPWLGTAPFTDEKHIFVNLGDGTYFHSGILAIRQAVAAGVNVTYKLLYNDAVAMTGGQPVDGNLTVPLLSKQIAAEGVEKIYLLSNVPDRFSAEELAPGTIVKDRDALDVVMRELRDAPGCSVIIYDQGCATELRRKRARGKVAKAETLAFINDAVCEGCGDCSVQSNCIAIDPLETAMGRKREINQSACNADLSCVKGFCPSFVTVKGTRPRKDAGIALPDEVLPEAPVMAAPDSPYNIAVTGVGGAGVLTVGHILGTAAYIDGLAAMVLDMAGLAQKGGAVISHVRLARRADVVRAPHIPIGTADLLIAPDLIVAASVDGLGLLDPARSRGVVNTHLTPVAGFISDRDFDFRADEMLARLGAALRPSAGFIDFHALAVKTLGDAIAANMMTIGYACQQGWLPISAGAIERAITLNGVAVDFNLKALRWGRFTAAYPERVTALLQSQTVQTPLAEMSLADIVAHRTAHLAQYQNAALAHKYRAVIDDLRDRENAATGKGVLVRAVAVNYANVLAYKDEYEVARLYLAPEFRERLADTFEGDPALTLHLSPPLLARLDPNTGRPRKMKFGPWVFRVFKVLAKLKPLRGTWFDIFGWSAERRRERTLIARYEAGLALIAGNLTAENHALAVALASAPAMVRGFGPVKMQGLDQFDKGWPELEARFINPAPPAPLQSATASARAPAERALS